MTEEQTEYYRDRPCDYFLEPHELDQLNYPTYDGDDRGGMVVIAMGVFALAGAVVGGLLVYLIVG